MASDVLMFGEELSMEGGVVLDFVSTHTFHLRDKVSYIVEVIA